MDCQNGGVKMIRTIAAALATSTCIVALATPAAAQTREYNIRPGSLKSALDAYVRQSGRQVVYRADQVRSARSPGVRGPHSTDAALAALLSGSGFTSRVDGNMVAIVKTSGNAPVTDRTSSLGDDFEASEIVVTAQKREERLLEVPVPVSVISTQRLSESNQLRIQDFFSKVPGLNFTLANGAMPSITLRGLATTSTGTPTAGIVIDDIPFGASTAIGGGFQTPDLDPSELSQIEVLRGPQGTLYGVGSLGGLLKYQTVDPSVDRVKGSVRANVNSVENGGKLGYGLSAAVNVPVSETFAVRVSGFGRREAGYIDNVRFNGGQDVNKVDAWGGRVSALWLPADGVSLKLGALYQDTDIGGQATEDAGPGLAKWDQDRLAGSGRLHSKRQLYSAVLNVELGDAKLTSLTGYGVTNSFSTLDYSFVSGLAQLFFGVTGAPYTDQRNSKKLSQEVRLDVGLTSSLDLLVGGFYTYEKNQSIQQIFAADPATPDRFVGNLIRIEFPTTYEEVAAFTDLTVRFSERFDVQVGGRISRNNQTYLQVETGPLSPLLRGGTFPALLQPKIGTSDNAFTYLVTPRFKVSPDLMLFARVASGYRAGGPNFLSALNGSPAGYEADTTTNYEIGAKGKLLDGRLSFSASLYQIDWDDIQLEVQRGTSFILNGAGARVRGGELSVDARAWQGMTLSGWLAYTDAKLTADLPLGGGAGLKGDRLPYSPKFSANISADQEFQLGGDVTGVVGGTLIYQGERPSGIGSIGPTNFAAYTQFDLRASLKRDGWTLGAYANNVTGTRGQIGVGFPTGVAYIKPRELGLSIAKTF
jgi:outer membrane receptor protein involved in Fe transport